MIITSPFGGDLSPDFHDQQSSLPSWTNDAGMTLALLFAKNGATGHSELKKLFELTEKEVHLCKDLGVLYTRYLFDVMMSCLKGMWYFRKRSDMTEMQLLLKEMKALSPDMYAVKASK